MIPWLRPTADLIITPGVFLTNYPTKAQYIREWWEERYLPVVKGSEE